MTILFCQENNQLQLIYSPRDYDEWILEKFRNNEPILIKKTFYLSKQLLINPDIKNNIEKYLRKRGDPMEVYDFTFKIASLQENYWRIQKDILETKYDVLIDKSVFIKKRLHTYINENVLPNVKSIEKLFVAEGTSIFREIDILCNEQIIIGGDIPNAISLEDFNLLIAKFPTATEKTHYANSRITNILKEYFYSMIDGEENLRKYFQRKKNRLMKISMDQKSVNIIPDELYKSEIEKFSGIEKIIRDKLNNSSDYDSETEWQNIIIEILPIIFPKYITILSKVPISESYSKSYQTRREIDFVLVNTDGYIDILEIKKACKNYIFQSGLYRDNYIPKRELSGAVMQVEKYIYYLNSLNRLEEEKLTNKYKNELPKALNLKIRNPKALILLGRSNYFNEKQKNDFEFIKKKYSNITDIFTYDDLLNRINNIIQSLQKKI